jgi:hypothetical protein
LTTSSIVCVDWTWGTVSVASMSGPVNLSCRSPGGTPVNENRPAASMPERMLVPTTVTATACAAAPVLAASADAPERTVPLITAPDAPVADGAVGDVEDPPHALVMTTATRADTVRAGRKYLGIISPEARFAGCISPAGATSVPGPAGT